MKATVEVVEGEKKTIYTLDLTEVEAAAKSVGDSVGGFLKKTFKKEVYKKEYKKEQ